MKVELKFESPFIVGGRKLVSNFIESNDYIAGDVLRAAFARSILNGCSEYKKDEITEIKDESGNIIKRKNWVYFRNQEGCINCKYKEICKKFSSLKFSFFYPVGSKVIPLTAMICKTDENHGFIDCMINDKKCLKCDGGNGRVEFVTGLIKDGKQLKVKKRMITKTSINTYTKTALDGSLYTIIAVDNKDNNYTGIINGLEEKDLLLFNNLRVGRYTSVGFGKINLIEANKEERNEKHILTDMKLFSEKFKNKNAINEEVNIIALKFISDCKVNFPEIEGYKTTGEYKEVWRKTLDLGKHFNICRVYAETYGYRGYDTSKITENKREEYMTLIRKGSVIVLKTDLSFEEAYKILKSYDGFGYENNNGFGDFEIYCGGVI